MTEPTDEQLDELWDEIGGYYNLYPEVRNTIRETLKRWGTLEPIALGEGEPTDTEILELAENFFEIGGIRDDGSPCEFYGTKEQLVSFARLIDSRGYNLGYDNGVFDAKEGIFGELIVEPTDDMREALATAIREIACEYNYQNFGEGSDLILDMNSLFELSDELET